MSQEQINSIEQNIKEAKVKIDLANALTRLESNRDFRKLIAEGYFKDEAVRLVTALGDPNMQSTDKRASIVRQMDSIGNLSDYFREVARQGRMALVSVKDGEDALEELRQEAM